MYSVIVLFLFVFLPRLIYAQTDGLTYPWPVTPFNSSHGLNATFCEFRNTLTSDHFHNAVDIGKADGEPCYPVIDGQVYVIDNSGSNSYVRVATRVDNQWKHFTYLHIAPNPALSVGDPVTAGVTILGTIYTGMGHVHLIERELVAQIDYFGAEINNIRTGGGLTPYIDNDPPVIQRSSLKFYLDGTNSQIPSYGLSGNVDIQIKIEEHNGSGSVQTNNGTYLAGYRIWSADTSQIVYEAADAGVRYRFDRKPYNSSVHQVFVENVATLSDPVYWLTNGGGADEINQSLLVNNNYLQVSLLDSGDYVLEIFSSDTRGNDAVEFFNITISDADVTPPAAPEMYYLLSSANGGGIELQWRANTENDLLGYRLYYAVDNQLNDWQLAADEFQLTRDSTSFDLAGPESFIVEPGGEAHFFRLRAVDSSGNMSPAGDLYACTASMDASGSKQALIVNGFSRFSGSGSWPNPTHSFVKSYFDPLEELDALIISSCSSEAIAQDRLDPAAYEMIIWFTGDESTVDRTFSSAEQDRLKMYLENGGKLLVSGSEIGWDMGRAHARSEAGDQDFYHNYLKANYVYDGNSSMSPATGALSPLWEGQLLDFGQVYPEDYPDDIDPVNGAQVIMHYNQTRSPEVFRNAGLMYSGTFGESQQSGQLVYLSFTFESVQSLTQRHYFMAQLLSYFNVITDIAEPSVTYPESFTLAQNYPNPFNGRTQFEFFVPVKQRIVLKVFDGLGREVQTIADKYLPPGEYRFSWNGDGFASGIYLLHMQVGNLTRSRKMLLLK